MVLVHAAVLRGGRLVAGLVVAASAVGCDPTYAINLQNQAAVAVTVVRYSHIPGDQDMHDVVDVPAGGSVTIATNGVASTARLYRLVLLDQGCSVVADVQIPASFSQGGMVTIGPTFAVTLIGGGNPPVATPAVPSTACPDIPTPS